MKTEVATQIRALLAKVETIIAAELAASAPVGVIVEPPAVTDAGSDEWLPGGFSRKALAGGFVKIRKWLELTTKFKWPQWLMERTPHRFVFRAAVEQSEFATIFDELAATANLGRRWSTISGMFTLAAMRIEVKEKPVPAPDTHAPEDVYWSMNDDQRNAVQYDYSDHGVMNPEPEPGAEPLSGAFSGNWNPAIDAEYLFEAAKERARAVCEAHNADPAKFGL